MRNNSTSDVVRCSTGIGTGAALVEHRLRRLPVGVFVVCYADDTLVLAQGRSHQAAAELATRGLAIVVDSIQQLGLELELHNSEAMTYYGRRNVPLYESQVPVGGVHIGVGSTMQYLAGETPNVLMSSRST